MVTFILAALTTGIVYGVYMLFKVRNAYNNQMIILKAISDYSDETGNIRKSTILLDNMEDLIKTAFRLWDWGYKNILPKEDFELIKPYLEEKNGKKRRID